MKQIPTKTKNSVKLNIKPLLAIMVCLALVYTSCRKTENAPAPSKTTTSTKTVSMAAVSKLIAGNLVKSLAGKLGGANLMDGVDSVSLGGHKGPHHGYNNALLCGLFTDSLVDVTNSQGDTVSHTGGNLTFYFSCKDGKSDGYVAYDSLNTTRTLPRGLFQNYYVKQAYTIKCLDDKHLFIGVNGDNYFYQYMNLTCGCDTGTYVDIENSNYVLNNLTIDICKRDILSGSATFTAYGNGWNVTGTIVFLGNHLADVTINGVVYHINLLDYQ